METVSHLFRLQTAYDTGFKKGIELILFSVEDGREVIQELASRLRELERGSDIAYEFGRGMGDAISVKIDSGLFDNLK